LLVNQPLFETNPVGPQEFAFRYMRGRIVAGSSACMRAVKDCPANVEIS